MLKTGIYRLDQLNSSTLDGFFGRRKFVAVTLYPEVIADNGPDRDRLLERILSRFPAANGTYKRTQRRRFAAFDTQVVRMLSERSNPGTRCSIHDVAVSDGRTAFDFFRMIDDLTQMDLRFLASDASPDVVAVSGSDASFVVVIDSDSQTPLQIIRPPFVFNVQQRESALLYPINRLILGALLRTRVRTTVKRLQAGDRRLNVSRIRLLAPDCLRLTETDPRFRFERYNILDKPREQYDVVRAMNVLNRSYFSDADIRLAVQHIHESLIPGGVFVTGSNQDAGSPVDGAVYERTVTGFRPLWSSGAGSPVHGIVSLQSVALHGA